MPVPAVVPLVCVVYEPVTNGTSSATLIIASWLSSVITDGVESTLFEVLLCSAESSAPMLTIGVAVDADRVEIAELQAVADGERRTVRLLSACVAVMMLLPGEPPVKLVPPAK